MVNSSYFDDDLKIDDDVSDAYVLESGGLTLLCTPFTQLAVSSMTALVEI